MRKEGCCYLFFLIRVDFVIYYKFCLWEYKDENAILITIRVL